MNRALDKKTKTHRFKLVANSMESGYKTSFGIYGILVIPFIVSISLMYYILDLRREYFWISFIVLLCVLINLYIFYRRRIDQSRLLSLIIEDDVIQIIGVDKIYLDIPLNDLLIKKSKLGQKGLPTIQLSCYDLCDFSIGLNLNNDFGENYFTQKLLQPDYLLTNQQKSNALINLLLPQSKTLNK